VSSLTGLGFSLFRFPALPCRAIGCPVPSGLLNCKLDPSLCGADQQRLFIIIACNSGGFYSFVRTTTNRGSSGPPNSPYALMDMRNGSVPAKNTTPYNTNNPGMYLMLARSLAQGEQYYSYP
jgi:hypothetical protein